MELLQKLASIYVFTPNTCIPTSAPPASVPPTPGLLKLPPEICNKLFAELPPSSQICLSLSCKGLYSTYFLEKKALNGALNVTHNVLQLLEKDMPGYYLCTNCIKFHQWEFGKDGSVKFLDGCSEGPGAPVWQLPSDECVSYRLEWRLVKLAHLYQMYGEGYGIPLSYLEKSGLVRLKIGGRFVNACKGILTHEQWEVKFVRGKLLLRTQYTLTTTETFSWPLDNIMNYVLNGEADELPWREMTLICSQVPLVDVLKEVGFNLELETSDEGPVPYLCDCEERYFASEPGEPGEVKPECCSYYEAEKIRDPETGGWTLIITVFRSLGSRWGHRRAGATAFPGWDLVFTGDGKILWEEDDANSMV